jgi:uncharacterized membrane protein YeaQ/YmgE (transglycosylase-associated protein family)
MIAFMWTVIYALFIGLIIGGLARLFLPGKQKISLGATFLIGFVAALVGGLVADAFGVGDTDGIDWIKLLIQIGLGMIGVGFWSGYFFRQNN